jgi:hypothetical protein
VARLEQRRTKVEQWITGGQSPIRQVELIQRRLDIDAQLTQIEQAAQLPELMEAFVNAAASWAERTGVTASALREVGWSPGAERNDEVRVPTVAATTATGRGRTGDVRPAAPEGHRLARRAGRGWPHGSGPRPSVCPCDTDQPRPTESPMESFEQFVAVAMETEGLVVSEAVKFPVQRKVSKLAREETQTHGYEVDLIGARADHLVLATVKSFFGSRGVVAEHVMATGGSPRSRRLYMLLNDPVIRTSVVAAAAKRYGYTRDQVTLRLYVGRFAAPASGTHEAAIRAWAARQKVGSGAVEVFGLSDVVDLVRKAAASKTYRDNPVLVTMKVLDAAGLLVRTDTSGVTAD